METHVVFMYTCSRSIRSLLKRGATEAEGGEAGDDEGTQASGPSTSAVTVIAWSNDNPQHVNDSGKLTSYFGSGRYNSMAATVSRMTACDGMPFHVFTSSPDIRRLMASAGMCLTYN